MSEAERLRAEQKESELRAGAQRKADMETAGRRIPVGGRHIVETVSTASGEPKRGGTLTNTAETTKSSPIVAAASEAASPMSARWRRPTER